MSVLVDIAIVLLLAGCLVHGFRRGLVGSAGSIVGLVAGGIAAAFVAPPAGALVPDPGWRPAATLAVAAVLILMGTAVGSAVGGAIGRPLRRSPLGPVDRALGAGLQLAVGALVVSVLASTAIAAGAPAVARAVGGSAVARQIEAWTPPAAGRAFDEVRTTVLAQAMGASAGAAGTDSTDR